MITLNISIVAALVAGVASMVLGFIWYGPLFANMWMKERGLTAEQIGNGPGVGYAITFVAAIIQGAVTSAFVHMLDVTEVTQGVLLGLLLAGGYVATTFASNYIFAQKSMRLYLIDVGYQGLNIVIAAVITTLIR